jgi:hypothetical protein
LTTTKTLPKWSAPKGDPKKPIGGWGKVPNATAAMVYNATPALGTYNHAAMIMFGSEAGDTPRFLLTWKNSPKDEDQPGQRVLYSQSLDGVAWTPTDGTNIMFPNMSTNSNPAALFAEPPIWLNGRLYAAASPIQFCLWPDQYQNVLLMRRVYTNGTGILGPLFWGTSPSPPAFAEASALNGVKDLKSMDAETQADVALLTPTSDAVPCAVPGNATNKCEACGGGCQLWSDIDRKKLPIGNERTHNLIGGGSPDSQKDVILYRTTKQILYASVRDGGGQKGWSAPEATDIPNDDANINAGMLPDGRAYLLSNAMPFTIRDPLTIATSKDGLDWSTCAVAMTCTDLKGDQCGPRYSGKAKNPGPSYPQGVVVPSLGALFVVATNNKENVWVGRLPLQSL